MAAPSAASISSLETVDRRAARLALVGAEAAEPLQQRRDLPAAAQRADAELLERLGTVAIRDPAQQIVANGVEAIHRRRPSGLGERRLCLGHDRLEGLGLARGEVGEHLAVELDPGALQAVDELRIGEARLARAGVDALDP